MDSHTLSTDPILLLSCFKTIEGVGWGYYLYVSSCRKQTHDEQRERERSKAKTIGAISAKIIKDKQERY